ncbi:hypothetical protein EIP86_002198 [Pleurotus ostreatoroseus]|nr:hypothetical protein EIP86_002198 [Pleurotus ostreatoroseus]
MANNTLAVSSNLQLNSGPSAIPATFDTQSMPCPPSFISAILPVTEKDTTVAQLLAFVPPEIEGTVDQDPSSYFSNQEAIAVTASELCSLPVPSVFITTALHDIEADQWKNGARSIVFRDKIYPWSILNYWDLVHEVIHTQRQWNEGLEWLTALTLDGPDCDESNSAVQQQAARVRKLMLNLEWNGKVLVDDNLSLTIELSQFLGRSRLTNFNIDQMLSVVQHELKKSNLSQTRQVGRLAQTSQIISRYAAKKYSKTDGGNQRIRAIGQALKDKTTHNFGGIFHVNGNHWVAVSVDVEAGELLLGDSLANVSSSAPTPKSRGQAIPAMRWWLKQHGMEGEFPLRLLPISQQSDQWSCGVLSLNALAHHMLPAIYPLIDASLPDAIAIARMTMFEQIVARNNEISDAGDDGPKKSPDRDIPFTLRKRARDSELAATTQPSAKKAKITTSSTSSESAKAPSIRDMLAASGSKDSDGKLKATVPISRVQRDTSDTEDDNIPTSRPGGRKRDPLLDKLTVFVRQTKTPGGKTIDVYKCIGCDTTWNGRTKNRVLKHATLCKKLPSELRAEASSNSADRSPQAQVDAMKKATSDSALPPASDESEPVRLTAPRPATVYHAKGREILQKNADKALTDLFCVAGLPPRILDLPEWKAFIATLSNSRVQSVSASTLSDKFIPSTSAYLSQEQKKLLKTLFNLTVSYDGGATRRKHGFYTVHVITDDGSAYLIAMIDGRGVSHTADWIFESVSAELIDIGLERFGASASDSTGNTLGARRRFYRARRTIFSLRDPHHHFNLYLKDICGLEHFELVRCLSSSRTTFSHRSAQCREVVSVVLTHFSLSSDSSWNLELLRKEAGVSRGLEKSGRTRFATTIWAVVSVQRCLPLIQELLDKGQLDLGKEYNKYFRKGGKPAMDFELELNQLLAVGLPAAKSIQCLEAARTTCADVYLFWLAVGATTAEAFDDEDLGIPPDVARQIKARYNFRFDEIFEEDGGKQCVHKAAFYLNPQYRDSDVWKKAHALKGPTITINGKSLGDQVPKGVRNPRAFLAVANFVSEAAWNEIQEGCNPEFTQWRTRTSHQFSTAIKEQFKAYSLGYSPFNGSLAENETPRAWWEKFRGTANAGLLAAVAIKLYSISPHSMADERTMSVVTWLNSARRANMNISTIFAQAQVRAYIRNQQPTNRKHLHSTPTLAFYDVKKLAGSTKSQDSTQPSADTAIYGSDKPTAAGVEEDDDSDDEELFPDIPDDVPHESEHFNIEDDEKEVNLKSVALLDILSDEPRAKPTVATMDNEDGGRGLSNIIGTSLPIIDWT